MFTRFMFLLFMAFALAACGSGSDEVAPVGNQQDDDHEGVDEPDPLITFIPDSTQFYLNRHDFDDDLALLGNQQTGLVGDHFDPFPLDFTAMGSMQCNIRNSASIGDVPSTTFYMLEATDGELGIARTYFDPGLGDAKDNALEMMASTQLTGSLIEDVLEAMSVGREAYFDSRSQVAPAIIVSLWDVIQEGAADRIPGSSTGERYSLYDMGLGFEYPENWSDLSEPEREGFTRSFLNSLSGEEVAILTESEWEHNRGQFASYRSHGSNRLGLDTFYCVSSQVRTPIASYFGVILPEINRFYRSTMASDHGDGIEFDDVFYASAVMASVAHIQQSLVRPYYNMGFHLMAEVVESPLPEWFRIGQQHYVASKMEGSYIRGMDIENSDSVQHPFDILVSENDSWITHILDYAPNIDMLVAYRYLVEANGEQAIIDMMMDIRTCDKASFLTTSDGVSDCFQDAFERHMVDDKGTRLTLERFRVDYQNLINRD